ncbi:MAG: helix-turn-helix domain-containing protein [[Lactobacillus] timonensis]|uniref:helix-turn-helix domain-containing protein n=1 Tax=[Lactobacillus] timonensis TaxID=1970790 RepID=UPI002352119F|nr:helix-turn-helix domain-containing protein [[Lactobacillus] timonensis]MCI1925625.1 helix-turn-helix domain-containing protein [[Lactobacillus] timonensis]MCI1956984.1 helix-turn-helix domain-containing protein [[Lactobacillus] timonensis]MCI1970060.1 helix-turn-helix domain-containing protein [[Lactobacillus] timonensis]MCI2006175.1 helix-turn-helix domain-containing protein [[Lactobacillus] timonensis]
MRASHKDWHSKEQLEKLQSWARDGLTDDQIASNVGCSRSTLNEWKKRYSDISDALKKGKTVVNVEVENALLKKALGTTVKTTQFKMVKIDKDVLQAKRNQFANAYKLDHPDKTRREIMIATALAVPTYERIPVVETVQEVAPDTSAAIFWLKNRLPEKYRDQVFRKLNLANAENAELDQELKRLKIKSLKENGQDMEVLLDKMLDVVTKEDKKDEPK